MGTIFSLTTCCTVLARVSPGIGGRPVNIIGGYSPDDIGICGEAQSVRDRLHSLTHCLYTEGMEHSELATAYHEAGHAVIALALGRPVDRICGWER